MKSVKEAVEDYISKENITKEALANSLEMSRSSLFGKLRGVNDFTLPEAYRLSRKLGCTLDEFYDMATLKTAS